MEEVIENFRARNSGDAASLELLRQKFLARLSTPTEVFAVTLHVRASDLDDYLQALVRSVPIPRGLDPRFGRPLAFAHLRMQALHRLSSVRDPRAYLWASVRNFYRDVPAETEDLNALERAAHRTRLGSTARKLNE